MRQLSGAKLGSMAASDRSPQVNNDHQCFDRDPEGGWSLGATVDDESFVFGRGRGTRQLSRGLNLGSTAAWDRSPPGQ